MNTSSTAAFSLDLKSLDNIKANASGRSDAALEKAAQQFESLLVQRMLHSMRDAIPKSGLLDNNQTKTYNKLLDNQLAQSVSQRGIGIADMMVRQLGHAADSPRTQTHAPDARKPATVAGIQTARPKALSASTPIEPAGGKRTASQAGPLIRTPGSPTPLFGTSASSHEKPSDIEADLPAYAKQFLNRMDSAAHAASKQTGLSRKVILAQAALETGWGRHEITDANGRASHNVFNVKATNWSGRRASAHTQEFKNGRTEAVSADFRAYDSYHEAFSDYAKLMAQSPRYRLVIDAPTADAAADRLQASGYATDPDYAAKLKSIMAHIPGDRTTSVQSLINHAGGALIDTAQKSDSKPSDSARANGAIGFG